MAKYHTLVFDTFWGGNLPLHHPCLVQIREQQRRREGDSEDDARTSQSARWFRFQGRHQGLHSHLPCDLLFIIVQVVMATNRIDTLDPALIR